MSEFIHKIRSFLLKHIGSHGRPAPVIDISPRHPESAVIAIQKIWAVLGELNDYGYCMEGGCGCGHSRIAEYCRYVLFGDLDDAGADQTKCSCTDISDLQIAPFTVTCGPMTSTSSNMNITWTQGKPKEIS